MPWIVDSYAPPTTNYYEIPIGVPFTVSEPEIGSFLTGGTQAFWMRVSPTHEAFVSSGYGPLVKPESVLNESTNLLAAFYKYFIITEYHWRD